MKKRRIVEFEEMRKRRKIGWVGLKKKEIKRKDWRKLKDIGGIIEGKNEGKRDIEEKLYKFLRKRKEGRKKMKNKGEWEILSIFLKDLGNIDIRDERMDEKRKLGEERRINMGEKKMLMGLIRRIIIMIVEERIEYWKKFRMLGKKKKIIGGNVELIMWIVRMGKEREIERLISIGKSENRIEFKEESGNSKNEIDERIEREMKKRIEIRIKIGKIEVEMDIEKNNKNKLC